MERNQAHMAPGSKGDTEREKQQALRLSFHEVPELLLPLGDTAIIVISLRWLVGPEMASSALN